MNHSVVDLFCGAGGLSLGLSQAGFKVIRSIDHNSAAIATYRENLGDHADVDEIGFNHTLPPSTVIAGGPPCQGFSSAGLRRSGDERNSLVHVFAQLIVRHRPLAFIFENVEGFLTGENGDRVVDLLQPLIKAGYRIHLRKVNAACFGVPQHRKRVVAIGGLGWDPPFPSATHRAYGAPGAERGASLSLPPAPAILEGLAGLPLPSQNPPGSPSDHYCRKLRDTDLERFSSLLPGQSMRDLPEHLWHPSFQRRANRRVMDGTPTERRGGAPHGIRRLKPDEPSKAITAAARNEFVHPLEDRCLTLRECARLQTFPDDYVFVGSAGEVAQMIGNAVPPRLAFHVGKCLLGALDTASPGRLPGALLSFVPTLASGMSPALEKVVTRIHEEVRSEAEQLALWA